MKISEERRASIVGAVALRHVRHDEDFARRLAVLLRAEVKAKADRAAIRDLLAEDLAVAPVGQQQQQRGTAAATI